MNKTFSFTLARSGEPMKGAGDLVAKVAEPIAKLSDSIFRTKLVGCHSCARRRARLNAAIPFANANPVDRTP